MADPSENGQRELPIIGYVVAEIEGETTYWAEVEPDSYLGVESKPSEGDVLGLRGTGMPMRITKRGICHAVLGGTVLEEEHWEANDG